MSEQNSTTDKATEAEQAESANNEKVKTGKPIAVAIKAETTEEKKKAERPGVCCGSCS